MVRIGEFIVSPRAKDVRPRAHWVVQPRASQWILRLECRWHVTKCVSVRIEHDSSVQLTCNYMTRYRASGYSDLLSFWTFQPEWETIDLADPLEVAIQRHRGHNLFMVASVEIAFAEVAFAEAGSLKTETASWSAFAEAKCFDWEEMNEAVRLCSRLHSAISISASEKPLTRLFLTRLLTAYSSLVKGASRQWERTFTVTGHVPPSALTHRPTPSVYQNFSASSFFLSSPLTRERLVSIPFAPRQFYATDISTLLTSYS